WICFYCESVNYSAILALRSQDAELMNIVTRMNGFVSEGNYGEAINEHKKLFDKYNDPFYMHSFGMLYMQSSNHEIRMIRYDRKGFMEENAVHKKNAIDNMSEAKHIFSRTSTMCEKEFSMGNINALLLYTYFMTNIKLRRLKTADRAIKMLSEEGSTFLVNYSKMVLEAELGNPNGVLDSAAKLTGKDATINAYYYRAWALFRLKQYNYAKSIIESLTKYLANESTDALTMDIERALSII
ncbi:MAG: hypothetical protein M1504_01920, partial [Candidatus Marsarchaeota archaeon]|nr:hypothetical protein [Candidatus Marsarchaeota archaeon]